VGRRKIRLFEGARVHGDAHIVHGAAELGLRLRTQYGVDGGGYSTNVLRAFVKQIGHMSSMRCSIILCLGGSRGFESSWA